MGMVNQLGKLIAEISQPLCKLLRLEQFAQAIISSLGKDRLGDYRKAQ